MVALFSSRGFLPIYPKKTYPGFYGIFLLNFDGKDLARVGVCVFVCILSRIANKYIYRDQSIDSSVTISHFKSDKK